MLKKFLKEVICVVVGKQAEEIVDLLDSKKYINEFIIAKKLNLTINQTRNILYKISDQGLVSSIRKKDKKKGWYTYFWRIEILKSLEFLRGTLIKKIDQFNYQIKSRETKRFYVCEKCNVEFNEENALIHDFTCFECGNIFTVKDNSKFLRELKKNSDKLKRELILLNEEIKKENEKLDKEKLKEVKKEERKKAEAKVEATALRKKLKAEADKKEGKEVKKEPAKNKIVLKKKVTTKLVKNKPGKGIKKFLKGKIEKIKPKSKKKK